MHAITLKIKTDTRVIVKKLLKNIKYILIISTTCICYCFFKGILIKENKEKNWKNIEQRNVQTKRNKLEGWQAPFNGTFSKNLHTISSHWNQSQHLKSAYLQFFIFLFILFELSI